MGNETAKQIKLITKLIITLTSRLSSLQHFPRSANVLILIEILELPARHFRGRDQLEMIITLIRDIFQQIISSSPLLCSIFNFGFRFTQESLLTVLLFDLISLFSFSVRDSFVKRIVNKETETKVFSLT